MGGRERETERERERETETETERLTSTSMTKTEFCRRRLSYPKHIKMEAATVYKGSFVRNVALRHFEKQSTKCFTSLETSHLSRIRKGRGGG